MSEQDLSKNAVVLSLNRDKLPVTVLAPLNGAACIQKVFFEPSDYCIKNE